MTVSRRKFLALSAALPLVTAFAPNVDLRTLARAGVRRNSGGAIVSVFGLPSTVASDVLLRATKTDDVPDGFAPDDLVSVASQHIPQAGGQSLRALVLDDTRALIEAASADGVDLYVGSGYRSQAFQAAVFAAQVTRWGDADTANRYSAQAGHSQHQLGTTIDFTSTFATFRQSPGPDWLRDNAHRFGFVLPYTAASVPLTGYVDEPWHGRWVGADLATALQSLGYQAWPDISADDVVAALRTEAALDG